MELDKITAGLLQLMEENHYTAATMTVYKRVWKKLGNFLQKEYGDTNFSMDRGLKYLEVQYGIVSNYSNNVLPQQRVQLLRMIHLLEDYMLHGVLTNRIYASKNKLELKTNYNEIHSSYKAYLTKCNLAKASIHHYESHSLIFLDYLEQRKIFPITSLTFSICTDYVKTFSSYSFKTIELAICSLRHFIRFLNDNYELKERIADKIHMPKVSKTAKIPSAWSIEEIKAMLAQVDRNNPIGKRDYAMMLLACVLGLRAIDVKTLTFSCFNWQKKEISFVQHKTHKPLTLPLPDVVGWAVIDYIKEGRPKYFNTDIIFLKHMPPFSPIGDSNHLTVIIEKYKNKAGLYNCQKRHSGFHSFRHSAASFLLENETPLPIISEILGHSDTDVTSIYLKNDISKLKECLLEPEEFNND